MIEGVLNFDFKLRGVIVDLSRFSRICDTVCGSRDAVDSLDGIDVVADGGKVRSSRENIDKSSPFH